MRMLHATLTYFTSVFGLGFVLGAVRVPLLVPRLGERFAELLELPIMLAASYFLARWVVERCGPFSATQRLAVGTIALALMVVAELGVVVAVQGQPLTQYVASRDPVSGTAYVLALIGFACMPVLAGRFAAEHTRTQPRHGA